MNKHAMLIGANGLVGSEVLTTLLDNEMYSKVTVVSRVHIDLESPKLEQHIIDFRSLHQYWELFTCDDIFYCMGTTLKKAGNKANFVKIERDYCINIAKIAAHNKVSQFLYISSKGADARSFFLYNRTKGEIEEELAKIGFNALQIFRPSVLLGKRPEFRFLENLSQIFLKIFGVLMVGFLKGLRGMPAKQLAKVMVRVAMHEPHGVNIYTNRRILEYFEKG